MILNYLSEKTIEIRLKYHWVIPKSQFLVYKMHNIILKIGYRLDYNLFIWSTSFKICKIKYNIHNFAVLNV